MNDFSNCGQNDSAWTIELVILLRPKQSQAKSQHQARPQAATRIANPSNIPSPSTPAETTAVDITGLPGDGERCCVPHQDCVFTDATEIPSRRVSRLKGNPRKARAPAQRMAES